MITKRNALNRIFALLFSVLVFIMVLFVSYIPSNASNLTIRFVKDGTTYGYASSYDNGTWTHTELNLSNTGYFTFNDAYVWKFIARRSSSSFASVFTVQLTSDIVSSVNSSSSPSSLSSPQVLYYKGTIKSITLIGQSFSSSGGSEVYIVFQEDTSTPTPEPATPTPEPATPTPEPAPTPNPYGPGPVPTIPPGDQSYSNFFLRLASDAQSAFNAIFLSWNNANSRFYSGIFFIGFPIMLVIFGFVASIFFGDDD